MCHRRFGFTPILTTIIVRLPSNQSAAHVAGPFREKSPGCATRAQTSTAPSAASAVGPFRRMPPGCAVPAPAASATSASSVAEPFPRISPVSARAVQASIEEQSCETLLLFVIGSSGQARLPPLPRLGADLFPWLSRAFDKLFSLAGQFVEKSTRLARLGLAPLHAGESQ